MRQTACRLTVFLVACCLSSVLYCGCAEISPPPGGEVDRKGPYLLASDPVAGALNVEADNRITLLFSENVVEPTKGDAVFISPRQSEKPKVKWSGDRLSILLDRPYDSNQTYIVTVNSGVKDLRGNPLDSTISIAFSTGDAIDSGTIGGIIYLDKLPASDVIMALYKPTAFADSLVPLDSIYPNYMVTTNREGAFDFRYLPDGEYRLIGFKDKNQSERFNPNLEQFALPDRPIVVGGDLDLDDLKLEMTSHDTLQPEMLSAIGGDGGLVKVRLSKAVSFALMGEDPSLYISIRSLTDTTISYSAIGFAESAEPDGSKLTIWYGVLPEDNYRIEMTYDADVAPLVLDSMEFKQVEDKTPPDILMFLPAVDAVFAHQVKMRLEFSEPIDTAKITPQTFVLAEDDKRFIPLDLHWTDPFHLGLSTDQLTAGHKYRVDVTEFDVTDYAGLMLGDSLRSFEFTTLDDDSLGSVSGTVSIALEDRKESPSRLTFQKVGGKDRYTITVEGTASGPNAEGSGAFNTDLPAGEYVLTGFLDQDGDGALTPGSINPLRLAETYVVHADTVSVRARFETAGIVVEFK